jgi:ribosomal protein L33
MTKVGYTSFYKELSSKITYMAQDNLIRLVSQGDEDGNGVGHTIYAHKNTKKLRGYKIELKKFNPIAKKHTVYKEKPKK